MGFVKFFNLKVKISFDTTKKKQQLITLGAFANFYIFRESSSEFFISGILQKFAPTKHSTLSYF